MKKDTLLVLAIILIPIVVLGAIAVTGAYNISQEHHEGSGSEELNTSATTEIVTPQMDAHGLQVFEPLLTIVKI